MQQNKNMYETIDISNFMTSIFYLDRFSPKANSKLGNSRKPFFAILKDRKMAKFRIYRLWCIERMGSAKIFRRGRGCLRWAHGLLVSRCHLIEM